MIDLDHPTARTALPLAAEIDRLRAVNAELVAALTRIATDDDPSAPSASVPELEYDLAKRLMRIARAALAANAALAAK